MSAEVESMVYVDATGRNTPWHGLGTRVEEAPLSDEALTAASLDWEVKQSPAYIEVDGRKMPTGGVVNYRATDYAILGTVSDRYKVVQNKEAFAFTDELIGGEVHYETAGSLLGGRVVWLLAQLPDFKVMDDAFEQFFLFSNSHDGSSGVRCTITPVRVVCRNTLSVALSRATRSWSCAHVGNIDGKIAEARKALAFADAYNKEFVEHAERLALKRISSAEMHRILDSLFPIPSDNEKTQIKLNHLIRLRENFMQCYDASDIANYRGTGWGLLNAFSDMIFHGGATLRKSDSAAERRLLSVIGGNTLFDKAHELILAA